MIDYSDYSLSINHGSFHGYTCRESIYGYLRSESNRHYKSAELKAHWDKVPKLKTLENFGTFCQNVLFKSYGVTINDKGVLTINNINDKLSPHPSIISLAALLQRFYINDFRYNSKLKNIIERVINKCVDNVKYDDEGRIVCGFYVWYLNILDETPIWDDYYETTHSNGPNSYMKLMINEYNGSLNYNSMVPKIDLELVKQFLDENDRAINKIYTKELSKYPYFTRSQNNPTNLFKLLKEHLKVEIQVKFPDLNW